MMTSQIVKEAIRKRYAAPEWATFFEVANGTGGRITNYADALAMNLFPSRGLRMHGFEIKVSRSDWLSELKKPHKAEAIQRYCDHWWIVTPPDIIKDGELPPTWGHLILKGNGLNVAVKAPELTPEVPPRAFLASILRNAQQASERDLDDAVKKRTHDFEERLRKEADDRVKRELERRAVANEGSAKTLADILAKCGLSKDDDIRRYFEHSGFAEAVAFVHRVGVAQAYSSAKTVAEGARRFAAIYDKALGDRAGEEDARV